MQEQDYTYKDSETVASNPGNIRLSYITWAKYDTRNVSILLSFLIISFLLATFVSLWFSILVFTAGVFNSYYWNKKKEHFQEGAANPGLIVSVNPTLIAVATDLSRGEGYFPVLKIIPYQTKKQVEIGQPVGTVALYYSSTEPSIPFWMDFNPIPIDYATDEVAQIQRAFASYPEEDWDLLENGIPQISKPFRPGIYKIDILESDWINHDTEIGCD